MKGLFPETAGTMGARKKNAACKQTALGWFA
jgi:hypothetical protein